MPWLNNRKHEIFKWCFTVHTKASDISLYIYMYKKKKKSKKDTKEYLQSSLKQNFYIPFNKVPGQQSALVRNQTSSESWSKSWCLTGCMKRIANLKLEFKKMRLYFKRNNAKSEWKCAISFFSLIFHSDL